MSAPQTITLRLAGSEREQVFDAAARAGMSVSAYVRSQLGLREAASVSSLAARLDEAEERLGRLEQLAERAGA